MKLALVLLAALTATAGNAGYDKTWYKAEYWSGEYPNGFSVVKKNVTVPARTAMDKDYVVALQCPVEFKANYHQWNRKIRGNYITMSKIVNLIAKEDFVFNDDERTVAVKKGDVIEYLVYGAEGWFSVRINGVEYSADQDLFEKVEEVSQDAYQQDEWLEINCKGKKAYVLMSDLTYVNDLGNEVFIDGLDSWYRGFRDYGKVTDLTNRDLKDK